MADPYDLRPTPVTIVAGAAQAANAAGASGAQGALKLSGSGAAANAVLWDTGTDGAIPYTVGLVQLTGTFAASVAVQGSNNDGTDWVALVLDAENLVASPTASGAAGAFRFNANGWARLRAIIAAYTSGTVTASAVLNTGSENPNRTPLPLSAGSNTIGSTNAAVPYQDTVAPLAAGGSFVGTPRDLLTASGGLTRWAYFTAQGIANQPGTVFVEGSWDGGTYYALNGTAGTAVTAGNSFLVKAPATFRYIRARFVNGATAQTSFALTSMHSQA